ncbi:hypothetical protein ACFQX6_32515 [Streptosporangium lutulentum]
MIPCACLGAKVESFDPSGTPVIGEVGELVVTQPMPSMPVMFWNDPAARATGRATTPTTPACGGTATGSSSFLTGDA